MTWQEFSGKSIKEAVDKASGFVERGKEAVQQQKDQLSAALEAGKQAYREEKEKAKS